MKKVYFIFLILFFLFPLVSHADSLKDTFDIAKAQILSVERTEERVSEITQKQETVQFLDAKILSGKEKGKLILVENDYMPLKVGQTFFVQKHDDINEGGSVYMLTEPNRLPSIVFFTFLFLVILFLFGWMQGIRGLLSLIISLVLITFILIPGMLKGYSPILLSLTVSSVIIILGSYITHGFNRTTTAAVCGMVGAVLVTGILSYCAIYTTHLSGFASEESVYLKSLVGNFNIQGLLLSGILIGLLGVLYDAAISQAIAIEELLRANPRLTMKDLYARGIRIGREHIGALVDTLAIAYVGVSLPLLLLVSHISDSQPLYYILNQEIFATEIIRTLIGSIGLILAVPLTTYISVLVLKNTKKLPQSMGHGHHH